MDTIGLDLHKRESQLCVLTEAGEIVERRIVTSRERFTAVLGGRPRAWLHSGQATNVIFLRGSYVGVAAPANRVNGGPS